MIFIQYSLISPQTRNETLYAIFCLHDPSAEDIPPVCHLARLTGQVTVESEATLMKRLILWVTILHCSDMRRVLRGRENKEKESRKRRKEE